MMQDRRAFLTQSSVAMTARALNPLQGSAPEAPFAHHVLFWLKDKENKDAYASVLSALRQLRKIETVRFLHVGTPAISDIAFEARATDASYTFSYLALFDSREDKENYLRHPLHTKFFEDFGGSKGIISKAQIYDSSRIPD
jgi:hypothetical protein